MSVTDLIRRGDALDLVCTQWREHTEPEKQYEMLQEALEHIVFGLKELPSVQQWIPVSERLPEDDTEVLVTREIDGGRYVECATYLSGSWISFSDSYKIGRHKVIAWKPLPETYKGDTDGQP